MDFFNIEVKQSKKNGYFQYEVYPSFRVCHSKDLMVRGKSFYAVWNESTGLWSTDEYDIVPLVDNELKAKADEIRKQHPDSNISIKTLEAYNSGILLILL